MHIAVLADEADDDADVIMYDNSDQFLYNMTVYDIDRCILLPEFEINNEINLQIDWLFPINDLDNYVWVRDFTKVQEFCSYQLIDPIGQLHRIVASVLSNG